MKIISYTCLVTKRKALPKIMIMTGSKQKRKRGKVYEEGINRNSFYS